MCVCATETETKRERDREREKEERQKMRLTCFSIRTPSLELIFFHKKTKFRFLYF